jgi:hypothetical protein
VALALATENPVIPRLDPTPGSGFDDVQRDIMLVEFHKYQLDLRPMLALWDQFWSRWELETPSPETNPYISQFQSPYPFSHVETILPRIVGNDPMINYMAMDSVEDEPRAAMLTAVVDWQLQQMRFQAESKNFVRQALITGYSVAKVGWVRESHTTSRDVIRNQFHEGLMADFQVAAKETLEIVTRNEAFFETVDIYDFFWPVRAVSLNKCRSVWQRCWVSMEHLDMMAANGHYQNVSQVQPYVSPDSRTDLATRFAQRGLAPIDPDDKANHEVELLERWEDDRVTVIANRDIVLRDDYNPFEHKRKPYIDYTPVERPFAMDGVGIIKMMWDMNEDLSALKRQRRDAITYLLNPMWKSTEGIQESDIKIRPGGNLRVPDTEDIEPMTNPLIDFSASFQEEQNAKNDLQSVTGAFDYLSGVNPGGVQTATGVATISQEGNKRIQEMIDVFSERSVKRMGWMMSSLVVQFLDNEVAVPLYKYPEAAQAWEQLTGEAAPRIVKLNAKDVTTAGKTLPLPQVGTDKTASDIQKRSDAVQMIQAIAPILAAPVPVIDPHALVGYVLKQFGVDMHSRAAIMDTSKAQPVPQPPTQDGSPPAGGVQGAPGVAGPTAGAA